MKTGRDERLEFTKRLCDCLKRAGKPATGPTALQREFNLRSPDSVTIHAVRKWLVGEAIPAQAKLRVLANFLQVTPEWLRYGGAEEPSTAFNPLGGMSQKNTRFLSDYGSLTSENREIVEEVVKILIKLQKKYPPTSVK